MGSTFSMLLLTFALAAAPLAGSPAEVNAPIQVRVWRIDFTEPGRTDLDWQRAFDDLNRLQAPASPELPRHLPSSGKPLVGAETRIIHHQRQQRPPLLLPPGGLQQTSGVQMGGHPIQHRDPDKVDHLIKQLTGQISDIPTRGSAVSMGQEFREPVRTVADPTSGRILVTSIDRPRDQAPVVPPREIGFPPLPKDFLPAAPIATRLTHIGRIPFKSLAGILKRQGNLQPLSMQRALLSEGVTTTFELPFIHSRGEKGAFTVAVELHIVPHRLGSEGWLLNVQPHILSFEQSPRTIRMVLEQETALQPGETLALTHVLDPECARAPSMFEKEPPPSRTAIFITRAPS